MGCQSEVELGSNLSFSVTTHDPDTGILTDADAVPSYRIYEDDTEAIILNGNMVLFDDVNTTGFYLKKIACTTGNGFEVNKSYTVYIEATVGGSKGGISYGFRVTHLPNAIWDEAVTPGHAAGNTFGRQLKDLHEVIAIADGTAQAGSDTTITLQAGESAVEDFYKGMLCVLIGGTGQGQARAITGYDGVTLIATIGPAWATNPDATSEYALLSVGSAVVASIDQPACAQVQAEMEENGASILDTIRDKLPSRNYLAGSTATTGEIVDKTGYVLAEGSNDAIIADAVWNALIASYGLTEATFGYIVKAIIAEAEESALFTGTPSDSELASLALYQLGQEAIANFEDGTKRATLCKFFYPIIRDAVLRAYPWNFAIERQSLTEDAEEPLFGFAHRFALPVDPYCLRVLGMEESDADYKVEGRFLHTDEGTVKIKFIARITNSGKYDSLFNEAFIARLAATMAYPITRDKVLAREQWVLYEAKLREARTMDGMEGTVDEYEEDELTKIR